MTGLYGLWDTGLHHPLQTDIRIAGGGSHRSRPISAATVSDSAEQIDLARVGEHLERIWSLLKHLAIASELRSAASVGVPATLQGLVQTVQGGFSQSIQARTSARAPVSVCNVQIPRLPEPLRLRYGPLLATAEVHVSGTYICRLPSVDLEGRGPDLTRALDDLVDRIASYASSFGGLEPPADPHKNVAYRRWLSFLELVDVGPAETASRSEVSKGIRPSSSREANFRRLIEDWHRDCAFSSSSTDRWSHPNIEAIVRSGKEFLPIIVNEALPKGPDVFAKVLEQITGVNPAQGKRKSREIVEAWVHWLNERESRGAQ